MAFHGVVLTLFPELFPGPLGVSLVGKALEQNRWKLTLVPLRDYGIGPHATVDEPCYGGGPGMVFRPDVVHLALQACTLGLNNPRFLYLSPRGFPLAQEHLVQWAQEKRELVLLCGRYEGVDERVLAHWQFEEVSIGDFLLCGGELPVMTLLEGLVRLLPGVVGNPASLISESFHEPLLEHPQYTRPRLWEGLPVPEVLLSGHHQKIVQWKRDQSCRITAQKRPDLWAKAFLHTLHEGSDPLSDKANK